MTGQPNETIQGVGKCDPTLMLKKVEKLESQIVCPKAPCYYQTTTACASTGDWVNTYAEINNLGMLIGPPWIVGDATVQKGKPAWQMIDGSGQPIQDTATSDETKGGDLLGIWMDDYVKDEVGRVKDGGYFCVCIGAEVKSGQYLMIDVNCVVKPNWIDPNNPDPTGPNGGTKCEGAFAKAVQSGGSGDCVRSRIMIDEGCTHPPLNVTQGGSFSFDPATQTMVLPAQKNCTIQQMDELDADGNPVTFLAFVCDGTVVKRLPVCELIANCLPDDSGPSDPKSEEIGDGSTPPPAGNSQDWDAYKECDSNGNLIGFYLWCDPNWVKVWPAPAGQTIASQNTAPIAGTPTTLGTTCTTIHRFEVDASLFITNRVYLDFEGVLDIYANSTIGSNSYICDVRFDHSGTSGLVSSSNYVLLTGSSWYSLGSGRGGGMGTTTYTNSYKKTLIVEQCNGQLNWSSEHGGFAQHHNQGQSRAGVQTNAAYPIPATGTVIIEIMATSQRDITPKNQQIRIEPKFCS